MTHTLLASPPHVKRDDGSHDGEPQHQRDLLAEPFGGRMVDGTRRTLLADLPASWMSTSRRAKSWC